MTLITGDYDNYDYYTGLSKSFLLDSEILDSSNLLSESASR